MEQVAHVEQSFDVGKTLQRFNMYTKNCKFKKVFHKPKKKIVEKLENRMNMFKTISIIQGVL